MGKIDLSRLSQEEKQELFNQVRAEEESRRLKIKEDRDTLKTITNETLHIVFDSLRKLSAELSEHKKFVYDSFSDIIQMKQDMYGEKEGQTSHTFTSSDGLIRITLGYHTIDDYDDTVNVGIEKVKNYITALGRDENSKRLVGAVLKLLAKDQQGNLKASRVMQLIKMAEESGDADFMDAVGIIRDAYRPQKTKRYVIAKYRKPDTNEWVSLPLGMTEA